MPPSSKCRWLRYRVANHDHVASCSSVGERRFAYQTNSSEAMSDRISGGSGFGEMDHWAQLGCYSDYLNAVADGAVFHKHPDTDLMPRRIRISLEDTLQPKICI